MATYKNYKCSNCYYSFTNGFKPAGTTDNFTRLGPEYLVCVKCGTKNMTGKIPFTKMNVIEKVWVMFCLLLTYILYGCLISFTIVGGFSWLIENKKIELDLHDFNFDAIFIVLSIASISILSFFQLKSFFKDVKLQGY